MKIKQLSVIPLVCLILFAVPAYAQDNPCEDSTFVSLKKVPIDEMSQREYDYFMMMSKECVEFAKMDTVEFRIKQESRLSKAMATYTYFYIGMIIILAIGMLLFPT